MDKWKRMENVAKTIAICRKMQYNMEHDIVSWKRRAAYGHEKAGGAGHGCAHGQLYPSGRNAGVHPVGADPYDEQSGKGHRLCPAGAQPNGHPAHGGGGAGVPHDTGAAARQRDAGGGDPPHQHPSGGDHPRGGLRQHRHALAAGDHPALSGHPSGGDGGHSDGQRGGGVPLGSGGQGGHVLRLPTGGGQPGVDPSAGRPAAGDPAAGLRLAGAGAAGRTRPAGDGFPHAVFGVSSGHYAGAGGRGAEHPQDPGQRQRYHLHG